MDTKSKNPNDSNEAVARALVAADLEAVLALDKRIVGRSRQKYFLRRMQSAQREPSAHIQVAIDGPEGLIGFALARVLEGEFGRPEQVAVIETIDIDPDHRHQGLGQRLLEGIEDVARHKGIRKLQTQTNWNNHSLIGFLDRSGFALAPRHLIECQIGSSDHRG